MIERILVPLDGSHLAERVLPHVVAIARGFDSTVVLLRVLEARGDRGIGRSADALDWRLRRAEATSYLEDVTGRLERVGLSVQWHAAEGRPANVIVEFARDNDIDLIALCSHGRSGLSGWNISSVVQKTILRASLSILLVRAYQPGTEQLDALAYANILLPLDLSQRAQHVFPLAHRLARSCHARLVLAHAVRQPEVIRRRPLTEEETKLVDRLAELNREEADQRLEELREQLAPDGVAVCTEVLVHTQPLRALESLIEREDVDLVMLSAHGGSGDARRLYGSMAMSFIVHGTTPLLIAQDMERSELEPTSAEMAVTQDKGH